MDWDRLGNMAGKAWNLAKDKINETEADVSKRVRLHLRQASDRQIQNMLDKDDISDWQRNHYEAEARRRGMM